MVKVKMWVVIVLVFALGALAGSMGMRQYIDYKVSKFVKRGDRGRVETLLTRMTHNLDLTDSQQSEIRGILQESHKMIEEVKRHTDPQIRAIVGDSMQRIREKLTDEQKELFDKDRMRIRKHRKHPPLF